MIRPSRMILVIAIIIILVFVVVNKNSFGLKALLKSKRESVWTDKNNKYSVWEYLIKNLDAHDSCNKLSLITRERDYKLLECISRIGDNDHFIIAQTDQNAIIKYWIINKDKDNTKLMSAQIVEGPLDLTQFINRKRALNISELDFQKILK